MMFESIFGGTLAANRLRFASDIDMHKTYVTAHATGHPWLHTLLRVLMASWAISLYLSNIMDRQLSLLDTLNSHDELAQVLVRAEASGPFHSGQVAKEAE